MTWAVVPLVTVLCLVVTGPSAGPPRTVRLAPMVAAWAAQWTVTGSKTEPTYVEHVRIARRGDRFTLDAEANGQQFGHVELLVDRRGQVSVVACPAGATCDSRPGGFLSTVRLVAAARQGRLTGTAPVVRYAGRTLACVPGGELTPCLDTRTGAVLAQLSPRTGRFTGPTLDEATLLVREQGGPQCSDDR